MGFKIQRRSISPLKFGAVAAGVAVVGGGLIYAVENSVHASNDFHPFPLSGHIANFRSFDIASSLSGTVDSPVRKTNFERKENREEYRE
ncbi:unnamed protein product [Cylicocyclus nassatus]|uniref:Uncharacterized protein n=1 Tax=Cylicocyclus nassatus TaxID=53992 RepID=A0AA36GE06_CYLNA|nr:unnamed protein product [Cylicocyclus nassatus]